MQRGTFDTAPAESGRPAAAAAGVADPAAATERPPPAPDGTPVGEGEGGAMHRWLIVLLAVLLVLGSLLTTARIEREGHQAIWRNTLHTSDMMSSLLHDKTRDIADKLALVFEAGVPEAALAEAILRGDHATIDEHKARIRTHSHGLVDDIDVFAADGSPIGEPSGEEHPDEYELMRESRRREARVFSLAAHSGRQVHVHLAGPVALAGRLAGIVVLTASLQRELAGINDLLRLEMQQHAEHDKPGDTALAIFRYDPRTGLEGEMAASAGKLPRDALPVILALVREGKARGQTDTHQFSAVPVRDDSGRAVAMAVLSLDVASAMETNQKHARKLLYLLLLGSTMVVALGYLALERMISRNRAHTRQLAEALAAAEAATRAKSEFLANMSHEIRTPMNAVIGLTRLCMKEPIEGKARDYVLKANQAARHLLGIINDILDLSKVEAGKLTVEHIRFELATVTDTLATLFTPLAEQRALGFRISVAPDTPRQLWGDPLRLSQVLNNLVGNALKFTPQGEVVVTIAPLAGAAGHVRFSVSDTGIGLSEEQQARIFEPFAQADTSSTRRFGGTGLGLTICRRLVDLMGSRLEVASRPGEGSDFHFVLAIGDTADAPEQALARPGGACGNACDPGDEVVPNLVGRRILLVEDNELNQIVARDYLAETGANVVVAADGCEAVEAVRREDWDLVLMDMQMPVMDGISATGAIRRLRGGALPIVAMTAHALDEERKRCEQAGMDDFITKPIDPALLYRTLTRWLGSAEPARGREASMSPAARAEALDHQAALRQAKGDRNRLARWRAAFVERSRHEPARLREAVELADARAAADLAHGLKGTAAVVGACALTELAANCERAARKGAANWPELAALLACALDRVLERLQEESPLHAVESR